MRNNTEDLTLVRNYLQKYQFLIAEYELVKSKQHPKYRFVYEFHDANGTDRRVLLFKHLLTGVINYSLLFLVFL
ncbi:MAG: hypothetical protein DRI75_11725 [Bacteroidetes bacterium]|jgi:hypothetical protein|nr:MAG: hypothetical protein DRI75_11725 [Bacteroidota bacterium]